MIQADVEEIRYSNLSIGKSRFLFFLTLIQIEVNYN